MKPGMPHTAPWIMAFLVGGASAYGAETNAPPKTGPDVSITPVVSFIGVDGDKEKFRENHWLQDEWSGGIEELTIHQKLDKNTTLDVWGRALFDQGDYKLGFELARPELGFVRAGFTQYRKFFDGTGGFYPLFSKQKFGTSKDLDLDIGNVFVDVGLTLPNIPKMTLGYERQYKNGAKSMVEWGSVTETLAAPPRPVGSLPLGSVTKKILPAFKEIDETVDILKFDAEHTIGTVNLGNEFRFEHYQNSTKRVDDTSLNLTTLAAKSVTVREDFRHDAFQNVFRMDSHLNEKTYWSTGYLYSRLDGDADLRLNTTPFVDSNDKNWFLREVDLQQDSHVVNINLMLGPFAGFVGYVGLQGEKTDTDGSADGVLTEVVAAGPVIESPEVMIHSDNDKQAIEERVGARFTRIPYTTVYAEGRWAQQDIDLFEKELEDGSLDGDNAFKRFTDTTVSREQYTVGFNTSPLPRVTIGARYRRTYRDNDYDHEVATKTTAGVPTPLQGYSAFITGQEFTTDEVTAKLTLHPFSILSVTFKYELVSTEIETSTAAVASQGIPAGTVTAGNFDASIYSVSVTITPLPRLYLTGYFSYEDTRTIASDNGAHSVITYQGNVYTVMGSAGFAIDNKTDVIASYSFSRADNFENNGFDNTPPAGFTNNDYGLPFGVDNERHAGTLTLARKFTENLIGRLRYEFFYYRDTSVDGIDNYMAHMASAAFTWRF